MVKTFVVKYTPPFDWAFLLRHFAGRATPGVEVVGAESYTRTISLEGAQGVLDVRHDAKQRGLVVAVSGAVGRHEEAIALRVARMFDTAVDLKAVHKVLLKDAGLSGQVRAFPGVRVPGAWSAFEVLVRAIVGQQVSVKAASTIMGRIVERFGVEVKGAGEPGVLFPTARSIAEGDLEKIGMPSKRVEALRTVARVVAEEAIPFCDAGADREGLREALLELPGIGPWTVEYFALRALRDPDAWPGSDLVLRRGVVGDLKMSAREYEARVAPWRPWRAYAAMHVWHRAGQEAAKAKHGDTEARREGREGAMENQGPRQVGG